MKARTMDTAVLVTLLLVSACVPDAPFAPPPEPPVNIMGEKQA